MLRLIMKHTAILMAMSLVVGLYGCSHYSFGRLPEGEYAIVRGEKGVLLSKINGEDVGYIFRGGSHKLAPGTHTILFIVNAKGVFFPAGDYCSIELNAKPGHEYVVGERPGTFVISDSLPGTAPVERRIVASCEHHSGMSWT